MKLKTSPSLFARRALVCALALSLLAVPLPATWSIVVVDTKTREVAVGTATCLVNTNIQKFVPVIVPEHGGGASQALIDSAGLARQRIFRGLLQDLPPQTILNSLAQIGGHQGRQFGIVNLYDMPVTFTGNGAGQAKGGVVGIVGDLRYAIQGNVLTGPEVWLAAETALVNTPGDLSQKLLASMEAARSFGGDGRCSCSQSAPTSCGAPPAGGFAKSAHCGLVGLARVGVSLGICNAGVGCANGSYFLSLNFSGAASDPDPVFVLQQMYTTWRTGQQGRPDQVLSLVECPADSLVADGKSSTQVAIKLVDIEGAPLSTGGLAIAVQQLSTTSAVTTPGAVIDHGDGTYEFTLTSGLTQGTDTWRLVASDALGPVVLQPDVTLRVDPLVSLHIGVDAVSAAAGAAVPFTLNLGPGKAGQAYLVLGSASGTPPGTPFGGLTVPLNADHLYMLSLNPFPPLFAQTQGVLDSEGRASAYFQPMPGDLGALAGGQLDWAAVVLGRLPAVFGPAGFPVLP